MLPDCYYFNNTRSILFSGGGNVNTQVVQLNIRTSQEAKEYLAKKAKEEGRSLNNYVDQLFKRMAKEEKSAGAQL